MMRRQRMRRGVSFDAPALRLVRVIAIRSGCRLMEVCSEDVALSSGLVCVDSRNSALYAIIFSWEIRSIVLVMNGV